jgi:GNAT superfamily N-acetyltransferase
MQTRPARLDDVPEIVRLAGVMFESMGLDLAAGGWPESGEVALRERLGLDAVAFVVDAPDGSGGLVAAGAGSLHRRLPRPGVPSFVAGYVQWISTDPTYRRRGLAEAVMMALLGWFRDQGVRSVELHATPIGESLYERLGFDGSGGRAMRIRDLEEWWSTRG